MRLPLFSLNNFLCAGLTGILVACGKRPSPETLKTIVSDEPKQKDHSKVVLKNPKAYPLQVPPNFFRGKLRADRSETTCHIQGGEITQPADGSESMLVLGCSLFDQAMGGDNRRATHAQTHILMAKASEVFERKKIHWSEPFEIKETAPQSHTKRIAKELGIIFTKPFPLGHPSGMIQAPGQKGVWWGNSVYGKNGFSRFRLLDTKAPQKNSPHFPVADHIGAVFPHLNNFLIGLSWDSKNFIATDRRTGASHTYENKLKHLDIQDCDFFENPFSFKDKTTTIACGGRDKSEKWRGNIYIGRVQILEVTGSDVHKLTFRSKGFVRLSRGAGKRPTSELGIRTALAKPNHYGIYSTKQILPHEVMLINQGQMCFVPDDLPASTMICYEISYE
jgi:hypothetical protein